MNIQSLANLSNFFLTDWKKVIGKTYKSLNSRSKSKKNEESLVLQDSLEGETKNFNSYEEYTSNEHLDVETIHLEEILRQEVYAQSRTRGFAKTDKITGIFKDMSKFSNSWNLSSNNGDTINPHSCCTVPENEEMEIPYGKNIKDEIDSLLKDDAEIDKEIMKLNLPHENNPMQIKQDLEKEKSPKNSLPSTR